MINNKNGSTTMSTDSADYMDSTEVTDVLLADGWHGVEPGTYRNPKSRFFVFQEAGTGKTVLGPFSAVLAVRGPGKS